MRDAEEAAGQVAHGVNVAELGPGKRNTGKGRAEHHVAGSLFVIAGGDKLADVAADELHRLFGHSIGEGVRHLGDVGFLSVDKSVNAAGRRDLGGDGHDELGIEQGVAGDQVVADDGHLEVGLRVGDDGGGGHFAAGTGGGGDRDHRDNRTGNLAEAGIVGDLAAVSGKQANGLGDVHRAAAAEGDDALSTAALVNFEGSVHVVDGGVGLQIQELGVARPASVMIFSTLATTPTDSRPWSLTRRTFLQLAAFSTSGRRESEPLPKMIPEEF